MKRRNLPNEIAFPPGYDYRPVVLDFFCGAGGAAMGYVRRGYRVIGIDLDPLMLKRYPWECHREDAMRVLRSLAAYGRWNDIFLKDIVLIHASPPCEGYSKTARIGNSDGPMLIADVRYLLELLGLPYVIENVPEAEPYMINPIYLCGGMFPELLVYRHRLFETSFPAAQPIHPPHVAHQPKMGRPVAEGDFIQVVGHFSNADYARRAMDISWMGRDQLKEAIPPAYTEYIAPDPASLTASTYARKELSNV